MMEAKTVRSTKRGLGISQSKSPGRALRVEVVARDSLRKYPCWHEAFANERKDYRYYELVEDTLHPEFDYRYFLIKDANGQVRSIQPFFLLDQDLLVGVIPRFGAVIDGIRRIWPRLMRARTLMVGCVAGLSEGVPLSERGHSSERALSLERVHSSERVTSSCRIGSPSHASIGSIGLTASPSRTCPSLSAPASIARVGLGYRLRGAGSPSGPATTTTATVTSGNRAIVKRG